MITKITKIPNLLRDQVTGSLKGEMMAINLIPLKK